MSYSDNSTIRKIWEDPEDIQVLRREDKYNEAVHELENELYEAG